MSTKKDKATDKPQFDVLPSFDEKPNDRTTPPTSDGSVKTVKKAASAKKEKRPLIKGSLAKKSTKANVESGAKGNQLPPIEKSAEKPKKKKSSVLVKDGLTLSEHNEHAKLIFILCMILLTPLALAVAIAVIALFIAVFALLILLGGVMGLTTIGIVGAGVVLSLVGSAYGIINLLTGEGFALVAGQYELGLSLAIAGVTITASALLYSGMTDLLPYVIKKLGQFFAFLFKKVKKLVVWLYKYSTQL